jgi:uncharacterized protein
MRSILLPLLVAGCAASGTDDDAREDTVPGDDTPGLPSATIDATCNGAPGAPRVLVFSRENLWMHPSASVARQTFLELCRSRGFGVVASQDPRIFNERLPDTDVVVFGVTSGEVLDAPARAALEEWVRSGGGVIGIHSASATELSWPFFIRMIGAQFRGHAEHFHGRLVFENRGHPVLASSVKVPAMIRNDEWYTFWTHPEESGVTVLMSLDEQTMPPAYPHDLRVGYHAISWVHEPFGARVFYTSLGHFPETYAEPWFRDMLTDAVRWTARR